MYTLQLDENGCTHTNDRHGFSITFPPGCLVPNQTITLTIGVMINGPFQFPGDVTPVSPLLWVCGDTGDVTFLKDVRVVLPHCLDIDEKDNRGIEMLFMTAYTNHFSKKGMYIFESIGKANILDGHKAALLTRRFCSICLAAETSDPLKEQTLYCITVFKNKANSKIVFAVTYLLEACIQVNSM